MADKFNRLSANPEGEYYVDDACIACNACVIEAPNFFIMNDDEGYAYVTKQPASDVDRSLLESVLQVCPVEAIGNDG